MNAPAAEHVHRRRFLRQAGAAGAAFSAASLTPLLGSGRDSGTAALALSSSTPSVDPDEVFRSGRFAEARPGYERILERNPKDAHALARLGYIALLSNKFKDAEGLLVKAIDLSPDDSASKSRLADCFVRQDDFARAVPLLRDAGDEAGAAQYCSLTGTSYEIHGAATVTHEFFRPFSVTVDFVNMTLYVAGEPV